MADTDCLFWDGDDEEPPAYVERNSTILSILGMMDQACRNEFPAWCLDNVLGSIANKFRGAHDALVQIDEEDRDDLLRGLTLLKARMPHFIPDYPAEQFAMGLDAAMTQVILWSETAEQQALRHPDTKRDAFDLARALRNDMYNWCLIDGVRERRYRRHATTIAEMLSPTVARGAV